MHNVINPCTQRSLHDSMGVLSARAHISMCKCLQHGDFSDRALQLLNIVESWMKIWKSQSVMGPKWLHNVSALQEPGGVLNYCSIIWPYQGQKKTSPKHQFCQRFFLGGLATQVMWESNNCGLRSTVYDPTFFWICGIPIRGGKERKERRRSM